MKLLKYKPVLGALITLLLVFAYPFLPPRVYSLVPGMTGNNHIYDDSNSGGNSRATWLDEKTRAHWLCDIKTGIDYPFCGYHILFSDDSIDGLDVSVFDEIHLKLNYNGPDTTVRFYLRNFNPVYSIKGDADSSKFNAVVLTLSELEEEVVVPLREFTVAEWWVNKRHINRKHALPEFSNVMAVGVDQIDGFQLGAHEYEIQSLSFRGRWISEENWYLCIMAVWASIFLVSALRQFIVLNQKSKKDNVLIETITQMNSRLAQESGKYKELSMVDPLTGVFNRLGFEAVVDALATSNLHSDNGLIMLDVDYFKNINDNYGHLAGDEVLIRIASLIKLHTRLLDSVCRWGGEEFILLCPSTSEKQAFSIAEKIRKVIQEEVFSTAKDIHVTASFGVTSFLQGEAISEVLSRADKALYKAKDSGRNMTLCYSTLNT